MKTLLCILALVLHVHSGERINDALDSARVVYAERGEHTTILIDPGTYQEELTIDVPGLRLKNASRQPSIELRDHGVHCDPNAVRITWYYGHGYQYASMGETVNYGGRRTRRWNASVLVTAPDFYAENIIFENSFNLYVSEREAQDSLVDISQSDLPWTEKERPKKVMPTRPKEVGSTVVQGKAYIERAAAISFTETATRAHLKNCRAVGRQDVLYGDQGASVYWDGGVLQGGVDFIFGAMTLAVEKALIIANINGEKGDKCYIAAGRSGSDGSGKQLRGRLALRQNLIQNFRDIEQIHHRGDVFTGTAEKINDLPLRDGIQRFAAAQKKLAETKRLRAGTQTALCFFDAPGKGADFALFFRKNRNQPVGLLIIPVA